MNTLNKKQTKLSEEANNNLVKCLEVVRSIAEQKLKIPKIVEAENLSRGSGSLLCHQTIL